jgi:methyl-accepting chemotaxis protein
MIKLNQLSKVESLNNSVLNIDSSNEGFRISTNDLIARIEGISKKIKSIAGNSEYDFLQIGSKLQDFLSDSKESFQLSSSITSMLTFEVLKKGVLELNGLLSEFTKDLTRSVNTIENDKDELHQIIEKIKLIIEQMGDFRKIVKQLRMLGISIKIESSRLDDEGNDFFILAENVDALSHQISDKSENILKKANNLFNEITKTIHELEKLEIKQTKQSDIIFNETQITINTFEQNYNNSYELTKEIVRSSDNITISISRIITSLQSHDIIRQKMEHASEAMINLSDDLKKDEVSEDESDISNGNISLIHDVCELQIIQLNNAVDEFTSAVLNIITNLIGVNENVRSIHSQTTSLLGENSIFSDGSLNSIKGELTGILSGLVKSREISNELAYSIKSIVDIVSDLAKFIFEIEEVGTEIEIIALNARVKAARKGIKGSSLDVLAEAIQKLSLDAKNHTGSISTILNSVSEISQKLNMESNSSIKKENSIDSTKHKINEIMNSFSEMGSKTSEALNKLKNKVNNIKNDINKTIDSITIHKQVKDSVTQIIEELTIITNELMNCGILSPDKEQNTIGLMKKYSMQSERLVHNEYMNSYHQNGKSNDCKSTYNKAESFGENVELF